MLKLTVPFDMPHRSLSVTNYPVNPLCSWAPQSRMIAKIELYESYTGCCTRYQRKTFIFCSHWTIYNQEKRRQSVGTKPSWLDSLRTQTQCGCVERRTCTSSFFLTDRSCRKVAEYGLLTVYQRSMNVDVNGPVGSSSSSAMMVWS